MRKELKLYPQYVAMAFKSTLSFRADAIIQMVSFVLGNVIAFLSLMLMLSNVPQLGDWTFARIVFLFGFCLLPKAIDHIFFDNLWMIGWRMVRTGELDLYLTKPLNPLFQVIAREFKWDGFADLGIGIALICAYAPSVSVNFGLVNTTLLILCGLFAITAFTSIKLMTASAAFWIKQSGPLMTIVYNFSDFVKYPLDVLNRVLKYLLFFVVPFGLFLFLPISTLYDGGNMLVPLAICAGAGVIMLLSAYALWSVGLRRYDGSGN